MLNNQFSLIKQLQKETMKIINAGLGTLVHAESGSTVYAWSGSKVYARSGSKVHARSDGTDTQKLPDAPIPGLHINPKDAIGSVKLPLHLWPAEATATGCLGMLEGKLKYGRNNYVAGEGVIASIYVDAAKRHIDAWFAGEEVSSDTQNDHLGNALACLAIIVKTRAHGKLIDDRDFAPNAGYRKLVDDLTPNVKRLQVLFSDKTPRHFTIADSKSEGVSK